MLLFFINSFFLNSQEIEDYFSVRLIWGQDEYCLNYKMIIEKEEDGNFSPVMEEFPGTNSIEVLLPQGRFRCCVIPYDFLGRPGIASEWARFEIRRSDNTLPMEFKVSESIKSNTGPEPVPVPEPEPEKNYGIVHQNQIVPVNNSGSFELFLSAAWMPLIPLYGENTAFFGNKPSLIGAGAKIDFLFSGMDLIKTGVEATGTWYAFKEDQLRHAATAGLNAVLYTVLPNGNFAFGFRLGAGTLILTNNYSIFMDAGASFLWFSTDHFFLETGIDYCHLFIKGPAGYIRPWLGLGLSF